MNIIKEDIKQLAHNYFKQIIDIRRELHKYPEVAFNEYKTTKLICKILNDNNIDFIENFGNKTGAVALINADKYPQNCIAIRADIDALPITEKNNFEYKSQHNGIMHACGHDVHTASAIGCALILNKLKNNLKSSVKIIFQPAEEKLPGGALNMIKNGILENPEVKNVLAQHVSPELECGKIGLRSGHYMASSDEIYISLKGKGGHAALINDNQDSVLIASKIICEIEKQIKALNIDNIPFVLRFGRIIANGQNNVIPDTIEISGTFRTFDDNWRNKAHKHINKIIETATANNSIKYNLNIIKGYPSIYNNPELTEIIKKHAIAYLGKHNVIDIDMRMTADDFAYFAQEKPSCYYRLGTANSKKGITAALHTPYFDIDEDSLLLSIGLMSWLICNI